MHLHDAAGRRAGMAAAIALLGLAVVGCTEQDVALAQQTWDEHWARVNDPDRVAAQQQYNQDYYAWNHDVNGTWCFNDGPTRRENYIEMDAHGLLASPLGRPGNSDYYTRVQQAGGTDSYVSDSGASYVFWSYQRGQWMSADGRTMFDLYHCAA